MAVTFQDVPDVEGRHSVVIVQTKTPTFTGTFRRNLGTEIADRMKHKSFEWAYRSFNSWSEEILSSKKTSKAAQFTQVQQTKAVQDAGSVNIESAAKKLTEAQVTIGRTLSEVTTKLAEQLKELETVTTAVAARKQELEQTYGQERVLKSIDELELLADQFAATSADHRKELERQRQQDEFDYNQTTTQARRSRRRSTRKSGGSSSSSTASRTSSGNGTSGAQRSPRQAGGRAPAVPGRRPSGPPSWTGEVKKAEAVLTNVLTKGLQAPARAADQDKDTAATVQNAAVANLTRRVQEKDATITQLTHLLEEANKKVLGHRHQGTRRGSLGQVPGRHAVLRADHGQQRGSTEVVSSTRDDESRGKCPYWWTQARGYEP